MVIINQQKFVQNINKILLYKKINSDKNLDILNSVYLNIIALLELRHESENEISNTDCIKTIQSIFSAQNILFKTTELYEIMSNLIGEKNWNIASSKKIIFAYCFEETFILRRITSGFEVLDKALFGGFQRQALSIILAETNIGKTWFCIKAGVAALKNKKRVLHLNLEGSSSRIIAEYMKRLAFDQKNNDCITNKNKDHLKLENIVSEYKDFFMFKNYAGKFNNTIEQVMKDCEEIYKTFKFDLVIVDYGQLLSTNKDIKEYRLIMAEVFRGLDTISKKHDCAVVSPVQVTRNMKQKSIDDLNYVYLTSDMLEESFEIARLSNTILSLNKGDLLKMKIKVYLEKDNVAKKGQSYIIDFN